MMTEAQCEHEFQKPWRQCPNAAKWIVVCEFISNDSTVRCGAHVGKFRRAPGRYVQELS